MQKSTKWQLIIAAAICGAALAWGVKFVWNLRMIGYLDSGIGTLREIQNAEDLYIREHPAAGYTCDLTALGMAKVVMGRKGNGYAFELKGCVGSGPGKPNRTYQVTARPKVKGMPELCDDQTGIRRYDSNAAGDACLQRGSTF